MYMSQIRKESLKCLIFFYINKKEIFYMDTILKKSYSIILWPNAYKIL